MTITRKNANQNLIVCVQILIPRHLPMIQAARDSRIHPNIGQVPGRPVSFATSLIIPAFHNIPRRQKKIVAIQT
jgi:hypothetical protein